MPYEQEPMGPMGPHQMLGTVEDQTEIIQNLMAILLPFALDAKAWPTHLSYNARAKEFLDSGFKANKGAWMRAEAAILTLELMGYEPNVE